MIFIIRALSHVRKKEVKEAKKKKREEKKGEKNREGAMLLSFFHTCASK
jgi:hypothetical protein